ARALVGGRHAFLPEHALRGLDVAAGVLKRALRVHDPGAGHLAELLDEACGDHRHVVTSVGTCSSAGVSSAAGSSVAASGSARDSSCSVTPVFPAATPSAIARVTSSHERIASSLPGMT